MDIITTKGFQKVLLGGFAYTNKKISKGRKSIRWRCSQKKLYGCLGSIVTDYDISYVISYGVHNHEPECVQHHKSQMDPSLITSNPSKNRKLSVTPWNSGKIQSSMSASPTKKMKTFSSCSIQTDSHTPLDMLTSDIAPEKYWELLAEKRREALEETLKENKFLHEENHRLLNLVSKCIKCHK